MKRVIFNPNGTAIYEKETGITIRMDHDESRIFLTDYKPTSEYECPEVVHAELTSRCNLNCSYCYIPKEEKELEFEEWKRIFRELSDFGVFQLTFGGGEPFLRKDISKLAKYADDCGMNVTVTTNGMLLNSYPIDDLKIFRQINISYHNSAVAEGFHIEKTISNLKEKDIPVGVNLIVSKEYISTIEFLSELCKKYDALLVLLSYKPLKGDSENCVDIKTIERISQKLIREGLTVGIDSIIQGDCPQNERMAVISSTGEVYPCSFIRKSQGNITSRSMKKIWKLTREKQDCPYRNILG